jgi:biotin carboxylase
VKKRVLLLATTTGYQTRMFGEAADRLGVSLAFATDRCDQLDDPWWDGAIPIRFHREAESVEAILRSAERQPFDGFLAVGDRSTVIAAQIAARLGLPGHPPDAAAAARDKRLTRERLQAARLPVPWFASYPASTNPATVAESLRWPVVIKPLTLSGSRGVMRADNPDQFIVAWTRLRKLLESADVRGMQDPAGEMIQIESFIAGREFAVEALLHRGEFVALAVFDKPDPLDGPFFEETIYTTPSRSPAGAIERILAGVAAAAGAIGLHHGPIHAECRVTDEAVFVLEVAARPIGGLCAKALSFLDAAGTTIGLEELLLRHALGESPESWRREPHASGVMMIPIPRAGTYRRTDGVAAAEGVEHVWHVQITAKPDQQLVPLPEGASYLGFIFAKADTAQTVEQALRAAHEQLDVVVDRGLTVVR